MHGVEDELGEASDAERRGRLERVLRTRDGGVVISDQKGFPRLGQQATWEQQAFAIDQLSVLCTRVAWRGELTRG